MKCGACGRDNVAGARFCAFCGQALAAPAGDLRGPEPGLESGPVADARPIRDNPILPPRVAPEQAPPYPGRQVSAPVQPAAARAPVNPPAGASESEEATELPSDASRRTRRLASVAHSGTVGPIQASGRAPARPNRAAYGDEEDAGSQPAPEAAPRARGRMDLGPLDDPDEEYAAPADRRNARGAAGGARSGVSEATDVPRDLADATRDGVPAARNAGSYARDGAAPSPRQAVPRTRETTLAAKRNELPERVAPVSSDRATRHTASGRQATDRSADGEPARSKPADAAQPRHLPPPKPPKGKVFKFEDENDELDDDELDDFDEERHPSRLKLVGAGALALALMFLVLFFLYSSTGRRIRASMGMSSSPDDLMILAEWYVSQGNDASAEKAYDDVLRVDMTDYSRCLKVAQAYEDIKAYDRAEKLYVYLIKELAPKEDEPYDKLIALLDLEGKTDLSQEWAAYKQSVREAEATAAGLTAPVPDLAAGAYGKPIEVTFSGPADADIRYTIDGSQPGPNSNHYTGAVAIGNGSHELRAVSIRGGDVSAEYRGTYVVATLQAPAFNPPSGSYAPDSDGSLIVTLTGDETFAIHYTLDGTEPTAQSGLYEEPLMLGKGTTTVRAVAIDSAGNVSPVASATYVVQG